ncbi:sugar transferase [Chromobacterium phragmitis]|uniref:sugar transferase n=1 Tax=Chromobacterium amazonense TaxID=1382803 RepID=UPI0021B77F93|nr:sugar transferase [Chromobacterium amazonense]MBM2882791.1 sugar transferase [Chromobacterium amazonense]MDE1715544.1 sugar transferase [Chromobacterium amazonense]
MQRFFDILFSSLAIFILSPLLIVISIVLRFTGEGEILFLQERIGKGGSSFKLYKFATMLKNSPNIGTGTVTVKGDARILPIGAVLRKTKINELPQLFNILLGDMSIIGPRPLTQQTFSAYTTEVQEVIKMVKPGLSGVGSIVFRGEEDILSGKAASLDYYRNVIAPYKGELERWFAQNNNIATYFKAIGMTVWVVLFSNSNLVWKAFKELPKPPKELHSVLNYNG